LGDSNTSNIGIPSWCAKLGPLVSGFGWQVQNYGIPGGTGLSPNPLAPAFTSTAAQQLQAALATLKRLDQAAPSQSKEEADMMTIEGLIQQGEMTAARRLGQTFKTMYPNSIHLSRLDAMLKKTP
ncbi:MAG: hypothetical protein HC794_07260, partial [Nitrospiraceae bacterium]|nr:hypothetical protein [Nitrospiraceae bacterium]